MKDTDTMKFGAHKGKAIANVPATYLIWLLDNGKCFGELKQYIIDNLHGLRIETKNEIRPNTNQK